MSNKDKGEEKYNRMLFPGDVSVGLQPIAESCRWPFRTLSSSCRALSSWLCRRSYDSVVHATLTTHDDEQSETGLLKVRGRTPKNTQWCYESCSGNQQRIKITFLWQELKWCTVQVWSRKRKDPIVILGLCTPASSSMFTCHLNVGRRIPWRWQLQKYTSPDTKQTKLENAHLDLEAQRQIRHVGFTLRCEKCFRRNRPWFKVWNAKQLITVTNISENEIPKFRKAT